MTATKFEVDMEHLTQGAKLLHMKQLAESLNHHVLRNGTYQNSKKSKDLAQLVMNKVDELAKSLLSDKNKARKQIGNIGY